MDVYCICICKTQMMPPPDHQNYVYKHKKMQNIKAVRGVSRANHVSFMQLVRKK